MSFIVKFKVNEKFEVRVPGEENMMFAELNYNFSEIVGLKEEHKASFEFNSLPIKPNSMRKLKEIGIKDNSIIKVKTEKPLDYKPEQDTGSFHIPQNNFQDMGMNMNMNPNIYFGNMSMNQNMNNFGFMNMIQIVFNYSGNKTTLQANINTPFSELSRRFCSLAGITNKYPSYFLGSRQILSNDNQTLSELHIQNNSEISVLLSSNENEEYLNIRFNCQGKIIDVAATKNTKFCDLNERFLIKAGFSDKDPVFIINSRKIESTDHRTLAELNINSRTQIEVFFTSQVIGA
jgi:hypothetical protein